MNKLTINLVVWNGEKYIPALFESLRNQTFKDYFLNVLDNGSTDNTLELIKKEVNTLGVQYNIIEGSENLGFARGHNKLFQEVKTPYFLILNVDMFLRPDCLEKMVGYMDDHNEVSAVAPRLMKWDFDKFSAGETGQSFTDKIDTMGLKVLRSKRVVENMGGERRAEKNGENQIQEVFGLSGALVLFKKKDLEKVLLDNELFDSLYVSYKEDVDLAFRMRSRKMKSIVLTDAVAYHDRTASFPGYGDLAALKNKRRNQSETVRLLSYRNHLATLYKNLSAKEFLVDFPFIFWYEFKKFAYFLIFDRAVLVEAWKFFKKNKKELKRKRVSVNSN